MSVKYFLIMSTFFSTHISLTFEPRTAKVLACDGTQAVYFHLVFKVCFERDVVSVLEFGYSVTACFVSLLWFF